jgi:predicted dehydrogenase
VNWLSPFKERVTVITGDRGAFVADTLTADLTFHENGAHPMTWEALAAFRGVSEGDSTRFALDKREPLQVEHERFRDAVLAGSAPGAAGAGVAGAGEAAGIVTLREGMRTVEVAEAVLHSAATSTTIPVDPS